jgi:hypothetical protein
MQNNPTLCPPKPSHSSILCRPTRLSSSAVSACPHGPEYASTVVSTTIKLQGGSRWRPYSPPIVVLVQLVTFLSLYAWQVLGVGHLHGSFDVRYGARGWRKLATSGQSERKGVHGFCSQEEAVIGEHLGRRTNTNTDTHPKRPLLPFKTIWSFRLR